MQPVDTNRRAFSPWAVALSAPRALPWAGIGARRWRLRPSAGCGFLGSVTTSAFSQTDSLPSGVVACDSLLPTPYSLLPTPYSLLRLPTPCFLHSHQIGLLLGRRTRMANLFGNALRLCEQQQVIRPAGLGVGAAHVEAAEGMRADHGSCALAIQVEVADVELLPSAVELLTRVRVDGSRQPVFGIVGNLQGLVEAVGLDDGKHRPEYLLLRDASRGSHVRDDGRRNVVPALRI